jgi:site-specific DNA-cytosine methylase
MNTESHPAPGGQGEGHVVSEAGSVVSESVVSFDPNEDQSEGAVQRDARDLIISRTTKQLKPSKPETKGERPLSFPDVVPEIDFVKNMLDKHVYKTGLDGSLPPMDNLEEIFVDISKKAVKNGLQDVIKHLGSRKLRVVTMCSGTESPILALEMVSKCKFAFFVKLAYIYINHNQVFEKSAAKRSTSNTFLVLRSCLSNRPISSETSSRRYSSGMSENWTKMKRKFKVASSPCLRVYIKQKLTKYSTTAYGALCGVPENPDLLVAGFSCVDFSVLNNERRSLDDSGESGQTFRAILAYVEKHRPPIVVLENVRHAPWKKIVEVWEKLGYWVDYKIVDTKHFYLPQTRERGYMICIDASRVEGDQSPVPAWSALVDNFKRPASSPFTSWTLTEDEKVQRDQREVISKRQGPLTRAAADWSLYKIRHQDYRREAGLGIKRPISNYQDGGSCRQPDWMDRAWYASQVERVWDTIDMNHLRSLRTHGFDNNYKL